MDYVTKHPKGGLTTGEYLESDDGKVKVAARVTRDHLYPQVKQDLAEYKWNDSDFLLASYKKNGTHFVWEVMTMLLHGSADYIKDPKEVLMIEMFPISQGSEIIPPPRVINTHYRTDVLSPEFRKAKTVIVMRNPKDACVSYYYHDVKSLSTVAPDYKVLEGMPFSHFARNIFFDKDQPQGTYFDYTEYMWTLREDPNHLLVFYEDMKLEPVATIQKVNEFMGTNASPELVQKIADATSFNKMKKAKEEGVTKSFEEVMGQQGKDSKEKVNPIRKKPRVQVYRKGGIGDWKNHFTVADNEMFDEFLASWEGGKDIPFKY